GHMETIHVGDRCLCRPGDRLGSVRFVGRVASLKPGYWVGVEFDEPVGKGDGTVKGTRVFQCQPNYGGFLRPDQVEVGDFPPEVF
uniref:TUBULIN-SPECIFIC CHAPERONE, PUTATIVE n=1 Tax=Trypanosoma brucei TaxID=5691 RepID=UPI000290CF35|nr:Chain A, TUBULIN-SPECIFIC CHAPERONE, PUTATIVE [Trypanosoma brucei]4B6M_B Chain B, TUBULIN-SPECIFIC CHAPERONE, PUTATIVE [Trypanosoma brucei]